MDVDLFPRFVNAHLTAHAPNLKERISDWNHIVRTLLFPSSGNNMEATTIYSTSHLFFLGDLNFRLDIPHSHPLRLHAEFITHLNAHLSTEEGRKELKEYDQLLVERRKNSIFQAMFEADFWRFKCTYKFEINTVDQYRCVRQFCFLPCTYNTSPPAQKECLPGQTVFCTPHILIPQANPESFRFFIPLYLPIPHQTTSPLSPCC